MIFAVAAIVIAALIVGGVLAWRAGRRVGQKGLPVAPQGSSQVAALIEHANCLVWEATVTLQPADWSWEFTLHRSALSLSLFGEKPPAREQGLWYSFSIPEQPEMDRRAREAMEHGRRGYEQQFRVVRDGKSTWLQESVSIAPLGDNRFRIVGVATDITAQREAELKSRESQDQLQQLLSHANCMIWQANVTLDAAGDFQWEWFVPQSELYRRMAGDRAAAEGIMPWGMVNVPEFAELEQRSRNAMQQGLPGYEQVFRVLQADNVVWMHEQAAITHLGAGRWKIEGVVIDITAQRRAEEGQRNSESRLRHLLERADCTIWQARVRRGSDGEPEWNIFIPHSRLHRRIHGIESATDAAFDWEKLRVPEFPEMHRRARTAILQGEPGYEQVFQVPRPDGALWLSEQVNITPTGNDTWDLVGIVTDITARREAEEARRTSEARLQQVLEMADCMVWHATVKLRDDETYDWDLRTQRSVLYRRLFGNEGTGTSLDWRKLKVSEIGDMDQRFMAAFRTQTPSYENVFRVVSHLQVTWLRETITLKFNGPREAQLVGVITDVTSEREAQEARRASESQVQQMLATADCLLWEARVFALSATELRWVQLIPPSRLYRDVFGEDPGNPATLNWPQVTDAVTRAEIDRRAAVAIRGGATGYEHEFRAQRGDRVFWLNERAAITMVSPGEWRVVGVITDLTARRGAEQSVRASEIRYRSLFQHTPVAILETDFRSVGRFLQQLRKTGISDLERWFDQDPGRVASCARRLRVTAANATALRLLHGTRVEDLRRHRAHFFSGNTLLAIRAMLLELWAGRNTLETQLEVVDLAGGVHHMNVRWWLAQTEAGLDLSQSMLVLVDLTELKRAESALATEKERLAVTLRAMAEAVVTTDRNGRIQYMNPAAAEFTGWDPVEAAEELWSMVCRLERDRTGAPLNLQGGEFTNADRAVDFPPQTRLVTRDGASRLVEGCCAPIRDPSGAVTGRVWVFRDVTEQERLEQELIRATRLESVGVLAGGIAHDFNNILTGVMGNLALAQLDTDPATEVGERLREAEVATLRARDLTQQLLTFAKGGEPVRAAVQLSAMLRETATFALHGSSVRPIFHLAADLWPADADKGQIGRVVQNLVINAIQAMPGGGSLRLTANNEVVPAPGRPGLAPGNYVQIAVADTGEGIKPDHLPLIFDPYFTTKANGSGLGLAAVYSIVKKHGGQIEVDSVVGQGTTFRLWLPAMIVSVPATAVPMPIPEGAFSGRVLFMDDEDVIRQMATMMLQRLGFEVECALDGAEAVAKYTSALQRGHPFSLVIMDLTVPGGMGGRDAIVELRKIDPLVRAIVSSGYSSDPVLANFRAHGFCGVVAKPYRLEDFVQAIRDALVVARG